MTSDAQYSHATIIQLGMKFKKEGQERFFQVIVVTGGLGDALPDTFYERIPFPFCLRSCAFQTRSYDIPACTSDTIVFNDDAEFVAFSQLNVSDVLTATWVIMYDLPIFLTPVASLIRLAYLPSFCCFTNPLLPFGSVHVPLDQECCFTRDHGFAFSFKTNIWCSEVAEPWL